MLYIITIFVLANNDIILKIFVKVVLLKLNIKSYTIESILFIIPVSIKIISINNNMINSIKVINLFFFICTYLILRKCFILPTTNIILSAFEIAILLNIAFPPTVIEDIREDIITDITVLLIPVVVDKDIAKTAPSPPDMIPHTSPITSLQIVEILLLFFIKVIVSLAPLIFFELIEWNVASFAVITDTPIQSNIIPNTITEIRIIAKATSLNTAAMSESSGAVSMYVNLLYCFITSLPSASLRRAAG